MGKPPGGVKMVMEAICLMFAIKPDKVRCNTTIVCLENTPVRADAPTFSAILLPLTIAPLPSLLHGATYPQVKDPDSGKKVDDYWGPAKKKLLGDSNFLKNLMDYDKVTLLLCISLNI